MTGIAFSAAVKSASPLVMTGTQTELARCATEASVIGATPWTSKVTFTRRTASTRSAEGA